MKKATNTTNKTIFSIYAEDRKGLVWQVLVHFNKRSFDVQSLNVARTDIRDLVMLTIEAVNTYGNNLKKTGFYRMASAALNNGLWLLMGGCGAVLSSMGDRSFVISKTGVMLIWLLCMGSWRGRICWGFVRAG